MSGGATSFSLPGDLLTRKSRGDRQLGKVILADVIAKLTRLEADGRSVGGIVTVMGKTREMRGIPVLLDNGRVRVRVAQGRGSRSLVIPRAGAWSQTASCPAGYIVVTIASTPPTQMCAPIPT